MRQNLNMDLFDQNCNNLIFSKSKNSSTKTKSLPTLELMSAFLSLKCLPSILNALESKVTEINLFLDAQIVISWIFSGAAKLKMYLQTTD